jgi:hypothetical protein
MYRATASLVPNQLHGRDALYQGMTSVMPKRGEEESWVLTPAGLHATRKRRAEGAGAGYPYRGSRLLNTDNKATYGFSRGPLIYPDPVVVRRSQTLPEGEDENGHG